MACWLPRASAAPGGMLTLLVPADEGSCLTEVGDLSKFCLEKGEFFFHRGGSLANGMSLIAWDANRQAIEPHLPCLLVEKKYRQMRWIVEVQIIRSTCTN